MFVEKAWKEAILIFDENWPFNEVTTVDIILIIIDVSHWYVRYYFFVRAERSLFLHNVENVGSGKIIFGTKNSPLSLRCFYLIL